MSTQSFPSNSPFINFQPLSYQPRYPETNICAMCSMVPYGATCPSCLNAQTTWANQPFPDAMLCEWEYVNYSNMPFLTDASHEYCFSWPEMTDETEMEMYQKEEEEGECVWHLDGEMMGMIGLEADCGEDMLTCENSDVEEASMCEVELETQVTATTPWESEEEELTCQDEDYDADVDDNSTIFSAFVEDLLMDYAWQDGFPEEEEVVDLHDFRPYILFGEFPDLSGKMGGADTDDNVVQGGEEGVMGRQMSYEEMVERWRMEL